MKGSIGKHNIFARLVLASMFAFFFQACGNPEQESSQLHRAIGPGGTGGTSGGKCKVVSGPNKGKTGTYVLTAK